MLKELDVPHEQIIIDLSTGENNSPEYRKINPMGKVPALVDGETVVTEVAAICAYLADKFPEKELAPEAGSTDRATYYRYLFITGNTVEPAFSLAASGIEHPQPSSAGWGDISRVLATIETMTPDVGWALGEQFTAADVVFGGLLDFSIVSFAQRRTSVVSFGILGVKLKTRRLYASSVNRAESFYTAWTHKRRSTR